MAKVVSLSEAAAIGLHAMVMLARADKPLNVVTISEDASMSKHHVAKVLQRLVKENFLSSQRGPSGGFVLKKSMNEVTLLQVYEAIEGKIEVTSCPMDKQVCPFDKCIMNNFTNKLTLQFRDYLASQTLDKYV